ncbi:MAG: sugar phosphate nucleotidyltransferase, partial [Promethearchaeota archaeon]
MVNAIILAGGFGTRLRPLSCTIPKPMLPILNKPLLNFLITRMIKEIPSLQKIVIAVNYRANDIRAYLNSWSNDLP